ncbi:MAG: molybdenum cofactor guanylyltransferase [Bacteroidales bacterium]|nr:molybdenum cofactor guanylyltransferase [Bacteroidota bacterium]MBL6949673.1 molybdenum cofactor guanylyltransferase [Bacteroidales bacterium]
MKKTSKIAGVILAGGKNARIGGKSKAFIQLNDKSFLTIITSILEQLFNDIIIVTNNPSEYTALKNNYSIITDKIKGIGPLGGINAALYHCSAEAIFVVPCDMPYLKKEVIEKVIEVYNKSDCDAMIPRMGSFIEPLHAIYKKTTLNILQSFINETRDYRIRGFLKLINVQYMEMEDNELNRKAFTNINTHEDFERISA